MRTYRSRDPLAGVHSSVVQNGRVSRTIVTPDMQTEDVAILVRAAGRHDLGVVGERTLQVVEVLDMVLIVVV